ncbi:MAG: N(4)-(beta-N-acetylglucosaminyl)-L-asparaginase [Fimbriimonadaceae bacterium]|nr:N(4)-(beta-N-acetylglucosaminyl)-L-asparaginase [Fimbriimonadaceae bacterium]
MVWTQAAQAEGVRKGVGEGKFVPGSIRAMVTFVSTWREPGKVVLDAALSAHQSGKDLVTCAEAGLAQGELDPSLMAIGLGSLPNSDGELELDASIMRGSDLACGAVCAVRGIVPVISVARRVMDATPHVMLAGDQARRFAIDHGFRPQNLMTAECIEAYNEWLADPERQERRYVHTRTEDHGDTVTFLGRDAQGSFVAASSTSGRSFKVPGRVGDSPIVGAGIYADDEVGAAGATGLGEELWKAVASFRAVEFMRHGMSAQEACEETVRQMLRRQPGSTEMMCVVIALGRDGAWGASTTRDTFPYWVHAGGETRMIEVGPPAP